MSDLSNKYKRALDDMDISPDFKERTAKRMAEIRDAKSDRRSRITIYHTLSAAAAAAACIAAVIAVNRTGMLDSDTDISVRESESITSAVTEATDIIDDSAFDAGDTSAETSDTVSTFADTSETEMPQELEIYPDDHAVGYAQETSASAATETELSTAAARNDNISSETAADTTAAETQTTSEKATKTVPEARISAETGELAVAEAEYVPPESPDLYSDADDDALIMEYEEDAAEEDINAGEGASVFSEPDGIYKVARGLDFSAYSAASEFDEKGSYAIITPTFEDYSESDGTVISYSPKEITGTVKMRQLISELALYAEDGTGKILESAPEDSRYVIDLADKQGNALRVYAGSGYVCFMTAADDGFVYYRFELTESENATVESALFGYVSK